MLRSLILATLLISSACAAIWPPQLGKFQRKSVQPMPAAERVQTEEYGLQQAEQADYGAFQVSAHRYKDSTGAYAASLLAPPNSLQVGNYLINCTGNCPKTLAALVESLPGISHASLPVLPHYFPSQGLVAHSERYILGPAGLNEGAPQIPEAAVAFQFGTEGELARYRTSQGDAVLAIFSYPTLEMARQQTPAFEAIAGATVKRSGFLVAVVLPPADRASAGQLLARINYQAAVSWDEQRAPLIIKPQTAAQMVLAIISLAGIVLGVCLGAGLVFAALRIAARRFGYLDAGTSLITLHLSDK